MNEKVVKFVTIMICALSMTVILATFTYHMMALAVKVAVLEAEVTILKKELEEQNTSEQEPIRPDRGGDFL